MARPSREQFEQLVHLHHAAVHRAALRVIEDPAAADATQEVFLRVWAGKEHLADARSARATLCWLATALACNGLRAARRRRQHEENAMNADNERLVAADPAAVSERAELHRDVQACVAALPSDLRLPLLLRWQDELTLAAIGSALRLSTSTVHDRIEQALGRLQRALSARGHSVALAGLGQLLAEQAPVPADGLLERLLAVPSAAAPLAAGLLARAAILFATAGAAVAMVVWQPWQGRDLPPGSSVVVGALPAPALQDPATGAPPRERLPMPMPPAPPAEPASAKGAATGAATAEVEWTGSVRDAAAWPVSGARIEVLAGGNGKPFPVGAPATTDARGQFTIRLDPTGRQLRAVRLRVVENGRELLLTGDLPAVRAPDAGPLELVLPPAAGTEADRYELAVEVRDESGNALAGVPVSLLSAAAGRPRPGRLGPEVHATSGADGRAVLNGRGPGAKWLFVDGRPLQRCCQFEIIGVATAGSRVATLAAGKELRLRVETVAGRPLQWNQPWLTDEASGISYSGTADTDGTVLFRGLGEGPFTVRADGDQTTAPATRRSVRPGGEPLVLRLKDDGDERDVGDHDAEVHGELFDAVTGAVVEYSAFQIQIKPAAGLGSTLLTDCVEPPVPAQVAAANGTWKRMHFHGLRAGAWIVMASIPGYALAAQRIELRQGEIRADVRLPLVREAIVHATVQDAAGRLVRGAQALVLGVGPLADAHIEAWQSYVESARQPRDRAPSFCPLSRYTDTEGTFRLDHLPAGMPLQLLVRHDRFGSIVLPIAPFAVGEERKLPLIQLPLR